MASGSYILLWQGNNGMVKLTTSSKNRDRRRRHLTVSKETKEKGKEISEREREANRQFNQICE